MATSYLSKTIQSNPYVPPVDLGLMEKVLTVKQKSFDLGVAKTQAAIDQMGNLDVMRDSDREYLNSKINNIISSVNSLGGVDYSDQAVLSQIEGLGNDVYGDDKVITALSSTRSVRNLMKTYQDFKTNPKLSKLYSQVNEAYDMRRVNEWMNNSEVGAAYSGPSTATPYTAYRENHFKLFEKMKADLKTVITDKGLYYVNEKNEYIRPERVMQMASDMLTPEERAQMKRDAWYLYNVQSPVDPATLIGKAVEHHNENLQQASLLQQQYQAQADAAIGDPEARARYTYLAEGQKKEVDRLTTAGKDLAQNALNQYEADPEEFQYHVYSQDYFRGLANRFSVNRTERSITEDRAQMFEERMREDRYQFDENIKRKDRQLDIMEESNKIRAALGLVKKIGADGKVYYEQAGGLNGSNINTQDPDGLTVSEKTILESNKQLEGQIGSLTQNFINELASQYPNLGITVKQNTTTGTGLQFLLAGQKALEGYNGTPGLQLDDLAGANRAEIADAMRADGATPEGIAFVANLANQYQAMYEGRAVAPTNLPKGAAKLFEDAFLIRERISANQEKIKAVDRQIFADAGLTQEEIDQTFELWKQQAGSGPIIGGIRGFFNATPMGALLGAPLNLPRIKGVNEKLARIGITSFGDFQKRKEKYLGQIATRDVFRTQTFNDSNPLVKEGNIHRFISQEISAGRVKGREKGTVVDINNITPIAAGMSADGAGNFYIQANITTGSGEEKTVETVQIPVSDDNAQKLGLHRDPYQNLNYSVNLLGRSGDIPVYGSKDLAVAVNVVKKNAGDLNNTASYAQAKFFYLDENNQKIWDPKTSDFKYELVPIPATDGMTPSEAYVLAKKAIELAGRNKVSYQDFKDYLFKYKP